MDDVDAKGDFQFKSAEVKSNFPPVVDKGVGQNEFEEIIIPASDGSVYLLHTEGRIGCDASLLLTIEPDGTEHAVVTHYDPQHFEDHLRVIRDKKESHPKGKRFAFLVTFGRQGDDWRRQIVDALSEYQGRKPDLVALPDLGVEQAKELRETRNKLKYQLAFTRGYGGKMEKHRVRVPGTNYEKVFTREELK